MFCQMYEEKYMRFKDGKSKALTFSYDDGVRADIRLIDVFNKHGLKGTFNLNSKRFDCPEWHDRLNEEETYKLYSSCGHEIALHGARHVFLNKVPLAEAIKEVADNRAYLEGKFGRVVRGMAYAYSAFNEDVKRAIKDLGVAYARTTASTNAFTLPADFLEWNPTCHHASQYLKELADRFFKDRPESSPKHRESWLFYIWGHSFEFDDAGNWNVIESFAKRAAQSDDVWFATNIQIYEYVQAYKNLVFSLDGERAYNPSAQSVWLELRGRVYEIPAGKEIAFGT